MEIVFPLAADICLKLTPVTGNRPGYPTSHLQKGLVLVAHGRDLDEEAVGFGVPVLKLGVKTIFAGAVELVDHKPGRELRLVYRMNLHERLSAAGASAVRSTSLYHVKNYLADIHRRFPATRRALTSLSNTLRAAFGWKTTYEHAGVDFPLNIEYVIDAHTGTVTVSMDASTLTTRDLTEVVLMNEQGAHYFDAYTGSDGTLLGGEKIGTWEEVTTERAAFLSRKEQVAFSLPRLPGARLFRGRELIAARLAWAGFGYSIPAGIQQFVYPIKIERLP